MAGCHTYRKRISALLDGELPPKKRAVLEDHLAECASCRRELAALKELGPILNRLEIPEPPAGLVVRIMAEAQRKGFENSLRPIARPWPAAIFDWPWAFKALGTAAILVLMLSFGVFVSTKGWLPAFSEDRTSISTSAGEGLEWFASGPPGSLVSGYLAMAGQPGSVGGPHP